VVGRRPPSSVIRFISHLSTFHLYFAIDKSFIIVYAVGNRFTISGYKTLNVFLTPGRFRIFTILTTKNRRWFLKAPAALALMR
jgi:hypothetical protein